MSEATGSIIAAIIMGLFGIGYIILQEQLNARNENRPSGIRPATFLSRSNAKIVIIAGIVGFGGYYIYRFWSPPEPFSVYDGVLAPDLYITAETSSGVDNGWVKESNGELCMEYPDGHEWGAVYITPSELDDLTQSHRDLSRYSKLSFEARTETSNPLVQVGIKDFTDLDDGSESKYRIEGLTGASKAYEYELEDFKTAEIDQLYILIEFVFFEPGTTICVKNIQYK